MSAPQRLIPSRREYNRWVADETLEDFALRYTPASARRWSAGAIANTAAGSSSFMALEAIGGLITLRYGFATAVLAIALCSAVIFATALPIALAAARRGIDVDLLTRGAGFGYIGSTITSLIYAAFTFIFFALEATIFAAALRDCLGLPEQLGILLAAAIVVPMVMLGISFINRFQRATQPVWLALTALAIASVLLAHAPGTLAAWSRFPGLARSNNRLVDLGAASSVIAALLAQVGEQVDYLRFLPEPVPQQRWRWWLALLLGGPGWILPGAAKLLLGSLLATLAFRAGAPAATAEQPVTMYAGAFALFTHDRAAALALAALLIVVAQLKINVTNAYAGSIAWSNFFSRLTQSHPGRVVWVVFNVSIAVLLVELGIYPAIASVLAGFSVVVCAWVGALVSDLVLVRPMRLAPSVSDFKRAHLFDINPVGIGAMTAAVGLGLMALAGGLGALAQAYAPFLALAAALLSCPPLAWATRGRFYLARKPRPGWAGGAPPCRVCGVGFAPADTAYCPAYGGAICSLCCTLDVRCHDLCKPHARYTAQLASAARVLVPHRSKGRLGQALPRFTAQFVAACGLVALLLGSVWLQATGASTALRAPMAEALWRAFLVLSIVAGVVVWLLTLAQESRGAALEESRRQTTLLEEEIAAHRRTDADLHHAKGAAEAANLAKSRFVVGVAHELRTPLNAVLGYAQLLEFDNAIPEGRREAVRTIRRGGEHLARLIEGLLDISKIEAGRIQIERRPVRLADFLGEIVHMFRLQAQAKGIRFSFPQPAAMPAIVLMDETRLRQVLINLLSNAIKFTERGEVGLAVARRGEVSEFVVTDTGPGIAFGDLERIFEAFERLGSAHGAQGSGIGLGLTISKLLATVMGGELQVSSTLGVGSSFRLRLLLSPVAGAAAAAPSPRQLRGYAGGRRTLVAADDDAVHRAILDEALAPLGFLLHAVPDAAGCLRLADEARESGRTIDAFLLDVSMPSEGAGGGASQMDGWQIARRLRETGWAVPIIVVSAHPEERGAHTFHDAFLSKPMSIPALHDTLGRLLGLKWILEQPTPPQSAPGGLAGDLAELDGLVRNGHVRAASSRVEALRAAWPDDARIDRLAEAMHGFRLDQAEEILSELRAQT